VRRTGLTAFNVDLFTHALVVADRPTGLAVEREKSYTSAPSGRGHQLVALDLWGNEDAEYMRTSSPTA